MLPRFALVFGFVLPLLSQEDVPTRAVHLLQTQCASCHGATAAMSGLRVDGRDTVLKGGTRGPAIKAGASASSILIQAVRHEGKLTMPPGKKLADADVELLTKWVDTGAAWPSTTAPVAKATKWWAFQPPVRPAVPSVPGANNPIDAFIFDKL